MFKMIDLRSAGQSQLRSGMPFLPRLESLGFPGMFR
jgi:hypothetical protein